MEICSAGLRRNWNLVLKWTLCDFISDSSTFYFRCCTYFNVFFPGIVSSFCWSMSREVSGADTMDWCVCNPWIYHDNKAEHTLERSGHMTPDTNISANQLLDFLCRMKCLLVDTLWCTFSGESLYYLGWPFLRWINHANTTGVIQLSVDSVYLLRPSIISHLCSSVNSFNQSSFLIWFLYMFLGNIQLFLLHKYFNK